MTNAPLESFSVVLDALTDRDLGRCPRGFVQRCDRHANSGEPARDRCWRMARVLLPQPGAFSDSAIAVVAHLRALLAKSPPAVSGTTSNPPGSRPMGKA